MAVATVTVMRLLLVEVVSEDIQIPLPYYEASCPWTSVFFLRWVRLLGRLNLISKCFQLSLREVIEEKGLPACTL